MEQMSSASEKINPLREKLDSIKDSLIDIKEKITPGHPAFDKFIALANKTTKWVTRLSVIGATLTTVNYHASHDELKVIEKDDGTKEYMHPDERTSHYLNVLGGREKITRDDILTEFRHNIKIGSYNTEDYTGQLSPDEMSIGELDQFAVEVFKAESGELRQFIEKELETLNMLDSLNPADEKTYDLVWQVEQECGNPKIRLSAESFVRFLGVELGVADPHYNPATNTVFLPLYNFVGAAPQSFLDELSHAKQFNDNQVGSYWRAIKDGVYILANSDFDTQNMHTLHQETYGKEGHLEHEAHAIIEPYLKNKYKIRNHINENESEK